MNAIIALRNVFNTKPKPKKQEGIHFEKTIPYRGYSIILWGKQTESYNVGMKANIYFEMGYRVNGKGIYHSGIDSVRIQEESGDLIESAKKYIDSLISLPDKIKSIEKQIDSIC